MNKKQMIQAIADKTFLETETIKKVLDACEICRNNTSNHRI